MSGMGWNRMGGGADVQNLDGNWYRTSDQMMPQKIQAEEISDQGYIYLFQKVH